MRSLAPAGGVGYDQLRRKRQRELVGNMDITFACPHCGRSLIAGQEDWGETIECPACGQTLTIPAPSPPPSGLDPAESASAAASASSPATRKRVIRLPAKDTPPPEEEDSDQKKDAEPEDVPKHRRRSAHYAEMAIGWLCLITGLVLEVLLPRAMLAYVPFFLGAVLMGIVLMIHNRVLHGLVLLLCTTIPPPLLAKQNVWGNISGRGQSVASSDSSGGARKVVFDSNGKARLVPDTVSVPQPKRYGKERPVVSLEEWKKPERKAAPPPEPKPVSPATPDAAVTAAADPFAKDAGASGTQSAGDPYRDLLDGAADVPSLVPEDMLEERVIGMPADFVWQEESEFTGLSADDPPPIAEIPFVIYAESGKTMPYRPSGKMGNDGALSIDESWDVDPHSGKTCMRIAYADSIDWVEAVWQHPPNNWGDLVGGYDFSRASKLTFWARGDEGGEKVEFRVGMDQPVRAVVRDSLQDSAGTIRLKDRWKKYSINLQKHDRSRIISAFILRVEGQDQPITFYLDDVRYE